MQAHGGRIIERFARNSQDLEELAYLELDSEVLKEVENIAYGIFSPLEGFMGKEELEAVLNEMRLPNDLPWTIPIVLPETRELDVKEGDTVALKFGGKTVATMNIEEKYSFPKKEVAKKIFKTEDASHPGVRGLMDGGEQFLGGKINLVSTPKTEFGKYALSPKETRVLFKEKKWKQVVGFQTRNVPHIGHEYVQKAALTFMDGIFINPVIGKKKPGDFRDDVILDAYDALIKNYYLKDRAVMSILKTRMRYAGPREAVFHAIVRKNFGCTHFIVGRDHAGVGNYYGPYEAQEIFEEFPDLGITPLFFRKFFYCNKCEGIVNEKTCPHPSEFHRNFSGTKMRAALSEGKKPEGMMREEVFKVINSYENPFVV
ncbi:sulfate adenylyltransferase [Candidatus Micrarchaeota archaeon]|nr:sulfate adenylyltransferase [Candidatus Micrarchaeota archaeon]